MGLTQLPWAGQRIAEIAAAETAASALRISVEGGGCSGFQYKFAMVAEAEPDDVEVANGGGRILIDPVSLGYLEGCEIDFVDDLIGASFKIKNPNATAACGCGTSFSI